MLSETEKFQSEVRAESERLIKQGVAPWEAAMQAGKNVQQKRKLTKRAVDVWRAGVLKAKVTPPHATNANRWADPYER